MYDVVTFGEAMVRLSSQEHRRLENADRLDVQIGGANTMWRWPARISD